MCLPSYDVAAFYDKCVLASSIIIVEQKTWNTTSSFSDLFSCSCMTRLRTFMIEGTKQQKALYINLGTHEQHAFIRTQGNKQNLQIEVL